MKDNLYNTMVPNPIYVGNNYNVEPGPVYECITPPDLEPKCSGTVVVLAGTANGVLTSPSSSGPGPDYRDSLQTKNSQGNMNEPQVIHV